MSELHQPYSEALSMPVRTAFDLIAAHARNNET